MRWKKSTKKALSAETAGLVVKWSQGYLAGPGRRRKAFYSGVQNIMSDGSARKES